MFLSSYIHRWLFGATTTTLTTAALTPIRTTWAMSNNNNNNAVQIRSLAPLVTTLSPPKLLAGNIQRLDERAKCNRNYGLGFRHHPPHVSRNGDGDVTYALFYHDDFMLVIFPGSKITVRNWAGERGNFSIDRVAVPELGGKVHEGFWEQVDSYWPELARKLGQHPNVPVVVGGHSRGGACAVIAGLRIEMELQNRLHAVITLGQPRCINRKVAERIQRKWADRYVRIVSSTDPVPLAPPEPFYYHAGTVWFYDKNGERRVNPMEYEIKEAIRRDNPAKMREHRSVTRYVKAMVKQAWECIEGHKLTYYHSLVHGTTPSMNGA